MFKFIIALSLSDVKNKEVILPSLCHVSAAHAVTLNGVYGSYYKKILTEVGQYPKEKVQVIGHPTYFDFEKTKNLLNKQEILKKNNFDNEKIILFPLSMRFFYIKNSPEEK